MKALLTCALFITSLNLLAKTCDLSEAKTKRNEINEAFDNGMLKGEDHLLALRENNSEEGRITLNCIRNQIFDGLDKVSLKNAIMYSLEELQEDIDYLREMQEFYRKKGDFLVVDQVEAEISRVIKENLELQKFINSLIK